MQMKTYWYVDTPYDKAEMHHLSQAHFIREFNRLAGNDVFAGTWENGRNDNFRWVMGSSLPTGEAFHRWKIADEQAAFNFMLACGCNNFKREEEVKDA